MIDRFARLCDWCLSCCCSNSFPLQSGTQWLQRPKTSSTRCWPLILPRESPPQMHSSTPGSAYVSHEPRPAVSQCSRGFFKKNKKTQLSLWCCVFTATFHRGLHDAQTGDGGVPQEIQRQKETQGKRPFPLNFPSWVLVFSHSSAFVRFSSGCYSDYDARYSQLFR